MILISNFEEVQVLSTEEEFVVTSSTAGEDHEVSVLGEEHASDLSDLLA